MPILPPLRHYLEDGFDPEQTYVIVYHRGTPIGVPIVVGGGGQQSSETGDDEGNGPQPLPAKTQKSSGITTTPGDSVLVEYTPQDSNL